MLFNPFYLFFIVDIKFTYEEMKEINVQFYLYVRGSRCNMM
jgi:hypothetical protein